MLARAAARGAAPESARALLHGAMAWLLSRKLPANGESVFPPAWGPGAEAQSDARAWCYGDPGIAAALLLAARAAGRARLGGGSPRPRPHRGAAAAETSGVVDAGLCHGAAGLGHLFNRLHQATGDPELLAAARAWLGRALDLREPGRGVGGFSAWGPEYSPAPSTGATIPPC